jgi:hypothetical protein
MTRIGVIVGLAILIVPRGAWAENLPNYDMTTFCHRVAGDSGDADALMSGAENTLNRCMNHEQDSYETVKSKWPTLPMTIQSFCEKATLAAGDGSYEKLKSCIEQKMPPSWSTRGDQN